MPIKSVDYPSNAMGGWLGAKFKWTGPTSYTQTTTGTPPTGGDSVPVQALGICPVVTGVIGGVTYDGSFRVDGIIIPGGTKIILVWTSLKTATIGGQSQTAGTEAAAGTNLSTFTVPIHILQHTL